MAVLRRWATTLMLMLMRGELTSSEGGLHVLHVFVDGAATGCVSLNTHIHTHTHEPSYTSMLQVLAKSLEESGALTH